MVWTVLGLKKSRQILTMDEGKGKSNKEGEIFLGASFRRIFFYKSLQQRKSTLHVCWVYTRESRHTGCYMNWLAGLAYKSFYITRHRVAKQS